MSIGGGAFGGQIADWIKSAADDTKRDQLTMYNMYDANRRENTRHSEWNTQMNFQQDAYYNRYANAVTDLRRAGLNPMLAVAQGQPPSQGGGTSVGGPAPAGGGSSQHGSGLSLAASSAAAAQASLVNAQADKLKAEADNLRADTDAKRELPALTRQQVQESLQRAKTLMAQESRDYASAAQAGQAVINMQAELPRIAEDVRRLRAVTAESLERAGLASAQAKEVVQRVSQNLPELERALQEFQVKLDALKVPGAQNAAMAQDSFVGVLGAYIKALLPLDSFMGMIPLGRGGVGPSAPRNTWGPKAPK